MDESDLAVQLTRWAERYEWTFAKTMAQIPHWYVIKGRDVVAPEFMWAARLIYDEGETRRFGRASFIYLDAGPFTYWVGFEPPTRQRIINRAERIGVDGSS